MSCPKTKELNEKRNALAVEARALNDKPAMSADESKRFDAIVAEANGLREQVTRLEQAAAIDADLSQRQLPRQDIDPSQRSVAGDMTVADVKGYSLLRALGKVMKGQPLDGVEGEASAELARRSGKTPQGFYFPTHLPAVGQEHRDVTIANSAAVKQTTVVASDFITALRNKLVIASLGARQLSGLVGDLSIPKQSATGGAYWVTEGNAPTESAPQINSQIALSPNTLGAFSDISRRMILQSSIDAENFVRNDLATVLALELDRASINGSGSGAEPTGVLQNSSITSVSMGANGAAPTWGKVVELETTVGVVNADVGNLAYLTNAKVRGALKTTAKDSGSGQMLWNDANNSTPLNGYKVGVSNAVPASLTKGTGTSLSAMIYGNWADLIWGMWSGVDVTVDPYTGSTAGTVRIVLLQDVDIKVRQTESFAKIVDLVA